MRKWTHTYVGCQMCQTAKCSLSHQNYSTVLIKSWMSCHYFPLGESFCHGRVHKIRAIFIRKSKHSSRITLNYLLDVEVHLHKDLQSI